LEMQQRIGHREDLWGYAGFSVLKSEVDALKPPRKDEQEESMIWNPRRVYRSIRGAALDWQTERTLLRL
jgi:hypothetical protein